MEALSPEAREASMASKPENIMARNEGEPEEGIAATMNTAIQDTLLPVLQDGEIAATTNIAIRNTPLTQVLIVSRRIIQLII